MAVEEIAAGVFVTRSQLVVNNLGRGTFIGSFDCSPGYPRSKNAANVEALASLLKKRTDRMPQIIMRLRPAAWAAIELYDDLMLVARGIADAEGRIALLFPYPPPRSFAPGSPLGSPLGSPPVATGPPLTEQVWILRARAIYAPPLSSPPNSSGTQATLPDLRYTLSQPEANIWADAARTELLQEVAVQFGHEQVLKSRPSSMSPPDQTRASVLFITPAASPP